MKRILAILISSLLFNCSPDLHTSNSPKYLNKVVVFGETHGTKEIPEFFFQQAVEEFQRTKNITVGLELPGRFNNLFIYFDNLKTPIKKSLIRNKLTEDEHWCKFSDGRDSDAMLSLLVNLIHLKYENPLDTVSILSLKLDRGFYDEGAPFFARKFNENNNTSGFVLIGNYHARLIKQANSFSNSLIKENLDIAVLNFATKDGFSTVCPFNQDCKQKKLGVTERHNKTGIYLFENKTEDDWYDGDFFIEKITGAEQAKNLTNECKDTVFKFTPFE